MATIRASLRLSSKDDRRWFTLHFDFLGSVSPIESLSARLSPILTAILYLGVFVNLFRIAQHSQHPVCHCRIYPGRSAMTTIVRPHEMKWLTALDTLAEIFSTCAKRKYAAVVLGQNKRVVGFGYNGSPPGMGHCIDGACPRLHHDSASGSSYDNCIAQHAEQGALLWSDPALRQNATLVVNGSPCMTCAKLAASSGISRFVGYQDGSYDNEAAVSSFLWQASIDLVLVYR
jgi:deoxycytidylate deaminase